MKIGTFLFLTGIAMLTLAFPSQAQTPRLDYYNDGTVNDFDTTFGDVAFGVPYNASFAPGGFLHGTPGDVPPFNAITTPGLVTLQGAAGGVAGGGFQKKIALPGGGQRGAIIVPYGTQAARKSPAGANWIANFRDVGAYLGVDPITGKERWRQGLMLTDGTITKLLKYIGDPQIAPPAPTLTAGQLNPIDLPAVQDALANPNTLIFFWESTGSRPLGALDLQVGDFELNTGYEDVLHLFPYLAVLENVGPQDFGLNPATAFVAQFNGDNLTGSGAYNQRVLIAVADPVVPEPGSMTVFIALALCGGVFVRRRHRGRAAGA